MAMGNGKHMLPMKAEIRRIIGKEAGEIVTVRLDERLKMFSCTSTFDPDLHLVVDGVPVSADRVDDTVHVFRLQSPGREVRIVSRSSVPAELDVASPT